ncbi:hypothetical protein [Alkalicoccus luteus]|nr:hypothetical protein [Alkalicoccus luteus]
MEKAMQSSHGMCYGEYNSKLENRMQVEAARDQEYAESQKIVQQFLHG